MDFAHSASAGDMTGALYSMQSETIVHEAANMFFRSKHPVIHTTLWIAVCVGVPGLPMLIGVGASVLQGSQIPLARLFDGIELLLISLGMLAALFVEFSRSEFNWSSHELFYFFVRALLFVVGTVNLIFLTLIYINNRVATLHFDPQLNVLLSMGYLTCVAIITVPLHYYVVYNRYRQLMENDET